MRYCLKKKAISDIASLCTHSMRYLQLHMSRGSSTGGGGGHWKESPKKNAMNELQDKLMTVRLREAEAQAELREVKLKALQLESQVSHCTGNLSAFQDQL